MFDERFQDLAGDEPEQTIEQVWDVIRCWPHSRETWDSLEAFGPQVHDHFWQNHRAWGLEAEGHDFTYAIENYIKAERPEFVVESLYQRAEEIPSADIVSLLHIFDKRVTEQSDVLYVNSLAYNMGVFFRTLRERADIPLVAIAGLEYRFLPLLRGIWSDHDPDSALDRCLSQNAEFFVQVLCNVFRAKAEVGKPSEALSADAQARARTGRTLLESFAKIPGLTGTEIVFHELEAWVSEVRKLARAVDRLEIAKQYVGKLLAHVPSDPQDQLWPHRVVRDAL